MFKVGLTRDFLSPAGELSYKDMGLDILDKEPTIQYEFLKEHSSPIKADMIAGYDAIISLAPAYDQKSFEGLSRLKAICRFGVGYDMVDVKACSNANVLVTITKGAVNYSMAEATIAWMLTLSHRVFEKDQLVRDGKWLERSAYMGSELRGRTLGIIGIGGIGQKLVNMLKPFNMNRFMAFDPYADNSSALELGIELTDLDTLLQSSDYISINCPLTDQTRNLIGKHELTLVKKNAFIINTARGGIVDELALAELLHANAFAGYATDVFADEPPAPDNPLLKLKNVILAPHCIGWTDDLFQEIGRKVCQQVVQISRGEIPEGTLNPEIIHKRK